jgi:hypothetical protein
MWYQLNDGNDPVRGNDTLFNAFHAFCKAVKP